MDPKFSAFIFKIQANMNPRHRDRIAFMRVVSGAFERGMGVELARTGKTLQPLFAPAGFDWRVTVGVLAAFPARELVIPTLGTLYSLGDVEADPDEPDQRLQDALRTTAGPDGAPSMNGLIAVAVMVFFALCSQCAATLAAIRRETHSWRWPVFVFSYMTALAWLAAVAIYQVGRLLGLG